MKLSSDAHVFASKDNSRIDNLNPDPSIFSDKVRKFQMGVGVG